MCVVFGCKQLFCDTFRKSDGSFATSAGRVNSRQRRYSSKASSCRRDDFSTLWTPCLWLWWTDSRETHTVVPRLEAVCAETVELLQILWLSDFVFEMEVTERCLVYWICYSTRNTLCIWQLFWWLLSIFLLSIAITHISSYCISVQNGIGHVCMF